MCPSKVKCVSLGAAAGCLLLVMGLLWVPAQLAARARDAGDNYTYLPVVIDPPVIPSLTRVSVASDGAQGNNHSYQSAISADGRYTAFTSEAANLVANDTNNTSDVFVHDRQTGETSRVSVASDGTEANFSSNQPFISADGRYVAFESVARNLINGDTNNRPDVFIHDRQTGETDRVSVASDGTQANGNSGEPSISADGRYVVFHSEATNLASRVSVASDGTQANYRSEGSSISADGAYVVFESDATYLVEGDTNQRWDVFVHDQGQ